MATTPALGTSMWALVVGVAMVKSGLTPAQAVGMSLLTYAGSAQLAALPLIAAGAPFWIVMFTAAMLNLRFLIYSAGMAPALRHVHWRWRLVLGYLAGDVSATLFLHHLEHEPGRAHGEWFLAGAAVVGWVTWQISSLVGIALAGSIPAAWGLDFAGTVVLAGLAITTVTRPSVGCGLASAADRKSVV